MKTLRRAQGSGEMSIEIEIRSGDAGWPATKPLLTSIWPLGGPIEWANPDLRVMIETPEGQLVCHAGIYRRIGIWKGRKVRIGGIGGVGTHPEHRKRGYAGIAIGAAIQTLRDENSTDFVLLVCEPHNFAFYEKRGWHAFDGGLQVEQKGKRVRFEAMAPYIFDMGLAPRDGVIDLCGLPW
jgi:aminoglycoside 2'-N-acetyltransferase I